MNHHPGTKKLQKVESLRIFEHAVVQIRELILDRTFPPGSKLPAEQELSKQLNVSRSSVREALRVLEAEGLVEVKRGFGTTVTLEPRVKKEPGELAHWLEQREETLEQLLQVRESIEGLAASLAAHHASPQALAEIRDNLDALAEMANSIGEKGTECDEDCLHTLADLDAAFHLLISSASGNDIVHEIISHVIPSFNESNKAVLYLSKRIDRIENEHRAILMALENRDPQAAEHAIREHIHSVKSAILSSKELTTVPIKP